MKYLYNSWSCRNLKNHWIYVLYGTLILDEHQLNVGKYTIHWFHARWFGILHMSLLNLSVLYKTCSWLRQTEQWQPKVPIEACFVACLFLSSSFSWLFSVFFCCRRHSKDAPPRSCSFWAPKDHNWNLNKPHKHPEVPWVQVDWLSLNLCLWVLVDFQHVRALPGLPFGTYLLTESDVLVTNLCDLLVL